MIEVNLHDLEPGLIDCAVSEHLLLEHLEDRCAFVLEVRVGILTVYVENDLAGRILRETVSIKRRALFDTTLRFGKVGLCPLAHQHSCFDDFFDGVRFSSASHTKQRCALSEKVLWADIDGNIDFLRLKAPA